MYAQIKGRYNGWRKKIIALNFVQKNSYFLNLVIFAGNNQHFSFFEKLSNLRKNILSNCFKKKQKD